jgi:plastocyanin
VNNARLPLALIAALWLAGCGAAGPETTTSKSKPPAPSPQVPSGTVIGIHDGAFLPSRVVVIVGHPVQWQNYDATGRQVQATKGATFHSGVLHTGQVFAWTPHHLGKVSYRDPANPKSVGTIVVVE